MPTMTDPPQRRFQFRLRTLMIVVTVLAVAMAYVGRQLKWIADRHEAMKEYGPRTRAKWLWACAS